MFSKHCKQYLSDFSFQIFKAWEKEQCKCGEDDVKKGIVQFFHETETLLSGFKLKTPLCLGSLISHQHILTSKYCFGIDRHKTVTVSNGAYREIVTYEFRIYPWSVKVLVGMTVGQRFHPDAILLKENQLYKDVVNYKIDDDSHFCIVILKDYVHFNADVGPLCVPEINNIQYESSVLGTILGFGYNEDFPDTMKYLAAQNILKERGIAEHFYEVLNATQCVDEFGHWFDSDNNWRKKWAFKRKGLVSWKDVPGYVWMEKFVKTFIYRVSTNIGHSF